MITIATTKLSATKSTSWVINYAEKRSVEKSEIMPSQVLKRLVNYMAKWGVIKKRRKKGLIMLNIKDQNFFKRALKIFILSTALLLVTIPIALIFHPSEDFIKQLGSSSPENVSKAQGLKKVWGFIQNNGFHVPIQMLLLALIPIPFLYTINLIVSVIIPGILFGSFIHFDTYKGLTNLIAYIPHYTLEIMSFCIFTSGLYMLNKSIIRKITNLFSKEKKENHSFKTSLFNLLKAYLFVCLPMVILAAFTETYIADMLSNLMN